MHPSPKNTIKLTGSPKARMPTNDATTGSRLARMLALPLSTLARPFVYSRYGSTVEMTMPQRDEDHSPVREHRAHLARVEQEE